MQVWLAGVRKSKGERKWSFVIDSYSPPSHTHGDPAIIGRQHTSNSSNRINKWNTQQDEGEQQKKEQITFGEFATATAVRRQQNPQKQKSSQVVQGNGTQKKVTTHPNVKSTITMSVKKRGEREREREEKDGGWRWTCWRWREKFIQTLIEHVPVGEKESWAGVAVWLTFVEFQREATKSCSQTTRARWIIKKDKFHNQVVCRNGG